MASATVERIPDGTESRHEFRQRLIDQVASFMPSDSPHESMTGVTRQVRHTGVPVAPGRSATEVTTARARNKRTLQQVAAEVSLS